MQLLSKKYRNGGEPLAMLWPDLPAPHLNLKLPAPNTSTYIVGERVPPSRVSVPPSRFSVPHRDLGVSPSRFGRWMFRRKRVSQHE